MKKRITNVYEEAAPLSDIFIEPMEPYKRDQYMQKFFEENKAEIVSTSSIPLSKETELSYSYYIPHVVNYPILEAAEMNAPGSLLKEMDESRANYIGRALILNQIEPQEVEMSQMITTIKVKKEDLMTFIDAVKTLLME